MSLLIETITHWRRIVNVKRDRTTHRLHLLLVAIVASAAATATAFADSDDIRPRQMDSPMLISANDENPAKSHEESSLYTRLGGYDGIAAVINETMPRIMADPQLGRFWANRGADGIRREKQAIIDFIANRAGGPVNYGGRDMVAAHQGMKIRDSDWRIFMVHLNRTLEKFQLAGQERTDVVNFMESLKGTMVE
jgi:hemoglobin